MLRVFAKGKESITKFLDDIWEQIAKWFLDNKKEFIKKLVLVNDATEFVKRFTLTTAQHINYGHVKIKRLNLKLPKRHPERILEEYHYTPKRGKVGKYKAQYSPTLTGMHNLNYLNRYVKLVGKLKLASKLPTGEKVYRGKVTAFVKERMEWCKAKESTFFSKKWSQEKIKKVVEEVSMNIKEVIGNKYFGITEDGIQI